MFKKLKEKLKNWTKKVSEKTEETVKEEIKEVELPVKYDPGKHKYKPDLEKVEKSNFIT